MIELNVQDVARKEEKGFVTDKKRVKIAKIRNGYVHGEKSIIFISKGTIEVYKYTRELTAKEEEDLKKQLREKKKEEIVKNKDVWGLQGGQRVDIIDGEIYIDDTLIILVEQGDLILYMIV